MSLHSRLYEYLHFQIYRQGAATDSSSSSWFSYGASVATNIVENIQVLLLEFPHYGHSGIVVRIATLRSLLIEKKNKTKQTPNFHSWVYDCEAGLLLIQINHEDNFPYYLFVFLLILESSDCLFSPSCTLTVSVRLSITACYFLWLTQFLRFAD